MAVVIPSRDTALVIGAQLEALITQDVAEPVEIVVVDNGSTDGSELARMWMMDEVHDPQTTPRSCNFGFGREVWNAIEGFDPAAKGSNDEVESIERARHAGFSVRIVPEALEPSSTARSGGGGSSVASGVSAGRSVR